MRRRFLLLLWCLLFVCTMTTNAQEVVTDTLAATTTDSVQPKKELFWEKVYAVVRSFSHIDHDYIESQHYNYTVMLMNTNTYERYTLRDKAGNELLLSPEPTVKLGPYAGWRWLVLGYTIDVRHIFDGHKKQDWDVSLYSNQIGIDLFYRKTGNDYKIRRFDFTDASSAGGATTKEIRGVPFDGFSASIKGFNIYYIINHQRFSYPAAFNQSTCQKISCGSPLVGIGFTRHTLSLDVERLVETLAPYVDTEAQGWDNISFPSAKVGYSDLSFSGGYAYNWVFARNWLAAASLSLALGYKRTTGDLRSQRLRLRDFSFSNFNVDGVGRFGLVWNNTRHYAGFSAILHAYNYHKSQFSTNSVFGSANIYYGYNFGNRHRQHKKKNK